MYCLLWKPGVNSHHGNITCTERHDAHACTATQKCTQRVHATQHGNHCSCSCRPPETIQSHDTFPIWGNWPLNIRSFRKIPSHSLGILWFKKQSNHRIASMGNVFRGYLPNQLENSNSQNNPITGYLPNRRELFQSQLDPFTRCLPNDWEIFDSRNNPITGYLPHLRVACQTISDPFAGYLPTNWEIFNSRSHPIMGYLPHLREIFQTIFDLFAGKHWVVALGELQFKRQSDHRMPSQSQRALPSITRFFYTIPSQSLGNL